MEIRTATWKDEEFVKKLDIENMSPIKKSLGEEYTGWMVFNSFRPNRCFIVENNKRIGFAYFKILRNKLEVQSFQIKKQLQKKRYGQKLMNYVVNFAKEKKLKKVILETYKTNNNAINFYEKLGFKNLRESRKNHIKFEFILK